MKHTLFLLFAIFFAALPLSAFAETIHSFTSDIALKQDGSFVVEETIVYDFEGAERHGIFRDLEKKHPQEATSFWKERSIDIDVKGVTLDGEEVPYEVTQEGEQVRVKIGDPHTTISGTHTYLIAYEVKGGLSYFKDTSVELYWNITGTAWDVPMTMAQANIHGDSAFFKNASACYKGPVGSNTSCDGISEFENLVQFSAFSLGPQEGLTVGQELSGEVFEVQIVESFNALLFGFIGVPLLMLGLIIFGYRYRTYFKTKAPIIAQYEPYKDFKPMYAGMLLDGVLDPRDITAGIVYLAEQGFIKVKKIDTRVLFLFDVDDYKITLQKSPEEAPNLFLKDILSLLFKQGGAEVITLGELKKDLSHQRQNALTLQRLRTALKKDMTEQGFYEVRSSFLTPLIVLGCMLFGLFIVVDFMATFIAPTMIMVLFIGVGIALAVFLIMYERRTRLGYEAQDHLRGFKKFLSVTDAERFKFHNAPEKSPDQFMEYLPYAIAFGVEKQWAKAFEGITIPNPGWYDGGSASSFSAVNLTSSLGAFSTSFAASSGSSGSSGGGSSGGGGGGGGGGSW